MATKLELMLEAEKRGILPPDKQTILDEARKRGIVEGAEIKKPKSDFVGGALRTINQVVSGGFDDEIRGAGRAIAKGFNGDERPFGERFKEGQQEILAPAEQFREDYPKTSLGLSVASSVLPGMAVAKGMNTAAQAPSMIKQAGAIMGTSGVVGFGSSDAETVTGRLADAGVSSLGGLATFGALKGGQKMVQPVTSRLSRLVTGAPNIEKIGRNKAEQAFVKEVNKRGDLNQLSDLATKNMDNAAKAKIPLTSAEALEDVGMMRQVGAFKNDPMTARKIDTFMQDRVENEIPDALERAARKISPITSKDDANTRLVKAAANAITKEKKALSAKAKPFYDKAYAKTVDGADDVISAPEVQRAIKEARRVFASETKDLADNNVKVLDLAKRVMDDDIGQAQRAGRANEARALIEVKKALIERVDDAVPDYKKARQIFAEGAPELQDKLESRLGRVANMKQIQQDRAVNELFSGSQSQTQKIADNLPTEDVQAGAAGYLRGAVDKTKGNLTKVQNTVFGNKLAKAQWKTVLGDKYDDFERTMDVISKAAKGMAKTEGSPTQPFFKADETISRTAKEAASDLAIGNRIGAIVKFRNLAGRSDGEQQLMREMADVLLSPRGAELVQELAATKAGSARQLATLEQINNLVEDSIRGVSAITGAREVPDAVLK